MVNKWVTICSEISLYNAGNVAMTETWLLEDIVKYYTYCNYQQFYVCRNDGRGGGLIFFNSLFSVVQPNPPIPPPLSCDLLLVVDMHSGFCWILVYRPPNISAEETRQLLTTINAVITAHSQATILGDLNFRNIIWKHGRWNYATNDTLSSHV
jgi:hypothetical protein